MIKLCMKTMFGCGGGEGTLIQIKENSRRFLMKKWGQLLLLKQENIDLRQFFSFCLHLPENVFSHSLKASFCLKLFSKVNLLVQHSETFSVNSALLSWYFTSLVLDGNWSKFTKETMSRRNQSIWNTNESKSQQLK